MPYNGLPMSKKHEITTVTFEARGKESESTKPSDNCG